MSNLEVRHSLSFKLSGKRVTLDAFRKAIVELEQILLATQDEEPDCKDIKWIVEDLKSGSACATLRGEVESKKKEIVSKIIRKVTEVGRQIESGRGANISEKMSSHWRGFLSVIGQEIPGIEIKSDSEEKGVVLNIQSQVSFSQYLVYSMAPSFEVCKEAWGVLTGRIEALSCKQQTVFTIRDQVYNVGVPGYIDMENGEEMLRKAWGRVAAVEGLIQRNTDTYQPVAIKNVKNIVVVDEVARFSYRDAMGCAPKPSGAPPAEEVIRRLRNGE